ncbi:MAPEG family protein [Aerobium aerolatum]|uniref:MAPEG family protein n=1 Tax=Aquamicrobium aerolatum DSM 21857 TaxID=1121003 RepID=A0A1I3HJN1_9HYPH|nr:MAPEG family protein [Aquamicrobium aerolatum]SFI35892.1 hypothetical protein SAMN03080618_00225 [Aquamicrobium aerolatum DSM 21857]
MKQTAIFWPMIGHVLLVFLIYGLLSLRRKAAVMSGSAKISQFRENQNEPAQSLFVRNALGNQFELPVLFHIACLSLYVTQGVGTLSLAVAWVFVVSRYAHTAIHVTSNRIRYRQPVFIAGFVMVFVLWLLLALQLIES